MHYPDPILDHWQHAATTACSTVVVPDGCRDLILHAPAGQCPDWLVTDLADTSYVVPSAQGDRFWGFRMQPGVQVDTARLLAALKNRMTHDPSEALVVLHDFMRSETSVWDALQVLAGSASVADAAVQLGVSERTLQRLVQSATGKTPAYWKRLARVRQAALALRQTPSLAACAADYGYTDQAHMTHEFRRWLGHTPAAVQTSPELLAAIAASGYC